MFDERTDTGFRKASSQMMTIRRQGLARHDMRALSLKVCGRDNSLESNW